MQVAQQVEGAALEGVGGEGEEGDNDDIDRHDRGVLVSLLESGFFENGEKHGPHEEEGSHLIEESHDEGRAENGGCEHPGPAVHEGTAHEIAGHPLGEVAVDDGGGQHEQEEDHDNHGVAEEHAENFSGRSIAAEDEGHDAEEAGPYGIHEGPQVDDAKEDQRHDHARMRYAQKNAAVNGGFSGASFASGGTTMEKLGRKCPENIMTRPMMVWMIFVTGILLAFSIHSLL